MGKPAARLTDMHTCPQFNPGRSHIPHVGGPIAGAGVPTVLIGGVAAAVVGDTATCVGPPDAIASPCSPTVLIGGKAAARVGDLTVHGGVVIGPGCVTVLIGP